MEYPTELQSLLGVKYPVIQAPMAGATNADFVISVCEAGAVGSLGAAAIKPEKLEEAIRQIQARTDQPFNVNLFSPIADKALPLLSSRPQIRYLLERYHEELDLGEVLEPTAMYGPFEEQLDVLVRAAVPIISFHFGVTEEIVRHAKSNSAIVMCTATSVLEAIDLERKGVDIVIAQGVEAGGHRGSYLNSYTDGLTGLIALLPQIKDSVKVPVVAAGGIMDARGIIASLALGASGVQMGTAFLGCDEAPVSRVWKDKLEETYPEQTRITDMISGRHARGVVNRLMSDLESTDESPLDYPAQYSVSRAVREYAHRDGDAELMVMWAGQGARLVKRMPVSDFVGQTMKDVIGFFSEKK